MSRATVELDFFGLERDSSSSSESQFQKFLHRQRSFRDIQSAISKIKPELLKSVIESGSANDQKCSKKWLSVPSSPNDINADDDQLCNLPVYVPNSKPNNLQQTINTAPLTIFFNGTVSVFDVPPTKAECILKLVMEGRTKAADLDQPATVDPSPLLSSTHQTQLLDNLDGDLPIARRKSLQRFLEKRKERMTSVSPYACYT